MANKTRPAHPPAGLGRMVGVGVIGLSAGGGWGAGAHLPAMSAVGGFEVRGLVGSSSASGRAASEVFGVDAYDSAAALAGAADIDLVVVAVKTPRHRELILPVLAAGKPVLGEWPFAVNLPEAEEMARAAQGIPTFVGLQGRSSPKFRWLADLVAQGYVGQVLSATVLATFDEWGGPVHEQSLYMLDRDQGATMLGIGFGHAMDTAALVVGELQDVMAATAVRHPEVPLAQSGRMVAMTAEDQIAVVGTLAGGAVLSAHHRGGTASGSGFLMVIDGTDGTLEISAPHHAHIGPVKVRGGRGRDRLAPLMLPESYDRYPHLADTAIHSLTHAYSGIGDVFRGGTPAVPDFAHAVRRHRLLDAVLRSAATGRRVQL